MSHSSRSAGVGGLCAVRQALAPICLMRHTRYVCRASGTATPTPAKSWWLANPLTFVGTPFRSSPFAASHAIERMPNVSLCASTTRPVGSITSV